jgi:hypothetical protein
MYTFVSIDDDGTGLVIESSADWHQIEDATALLDDCSVYGKNWCILVDGKQMAKQTVQRFMRKEIW